MEHLIPCDCFYINFIENWLMLTSLVITAFQSMLFDVKSTYLPAENREEGHLSGSGFVVLARQN